jgi:hypothetical protein
LQKLSLGGLARSKGLPRLTLWVQRDKGDAISIRRLSRGPPLEQERRQPR